MTPSRTAAAVQLAVAILSLLADCTTSIRCYASSKGRIHHRNPVLITCGKKYLSCHEYYQEEEGSNTIMYQAGCGQYFMNNKMEMTTRRKILVNDHNDCFTDGCNRGLLTELESNHRICFSVDQDYSYVTFAVVCARNETKCYLDRMTGAKKPSYFAGCGECPSYTLYCSTCSSNFCNATAKAKVAPRIVYIREDDESDRDSLSSDLDAAGSVCGIRAATLAALALAAFGLVRGAAALA